MSYNPDITIDVVEFDKNKFALISPDSISFISDIQNGCIEQIAKEEEASYRPQEKQKPDEQFSSIIILPTLDCNLRCKYCYSCGGEDKRSLSAGIALRAIDNLAKENNYARSSNLYLHFLGGGEPFLNFSCMKEILLYANQMFAHVATTVVTNGTFGKKELEWTVENNVNLRISYDGIYHDEQRPYASGKGSRETVEKNIKKLSELGVPFKIKITVTSASVDSMSESVKYIAKIGAREIHIKPVHYSGNSRSGKSLSPDAEIFVKNVMETINDIDNEGLDIKLVNSFNIQPATGYYCRNCTGKTYTITPDGDISACVEIARKSEKYSDLFFCGDTRSSDGFNIDEQKMALFKKLHYINYAQCASCNIRKLCLGGCPLEAVWDTNDLFSPSQYRCKLNSILYPQLLQAVYNNDKVLDIISDNILERR